jgi:cytochrome c-type biogenesis protein CcmH/NrfG
MLARTLTFAVCAAVVVVYALRGGSYDNVVFQEHGLVIWWVLAIGFALGLLPRVRPARGTLLLLAALFAYAAWTALSLIWSESSELTTVELARALGYLGIVTLAAVTIDRTIWREAALGIGFGALLVCALAVGVRLAPSIFGTDHVDATLGSDRLSYPFGYWNAVAAWGAMSATLGLAWSAHDHLRIRRGFALGLVPVAGLMTYLSYSRAGIAGVTVGVIAVIALSRSRFTAMLHAVVAGAGTAVAILAVRGEPEIANATGTAGAATVLVALLGACAVCVVVALLTRRVDRLRVPRRAFRPLAVAAVLLVGIPAVALGAHEASRAWHSFTRLPPSRSANPTARFTNLDNSRYPLWKSALHAWEAHPLDGTGAGTWQFWWNEHGTDGEFTTNTHSLWLENLAELGAPGLALIITVALTALTLLFAVRRRTKRSASSGAAAALGAVFLVYLVHASVDWMWQSTAVTVLALAAVAISGARLATRRLSMRLWMRATLALVAAVAGAVQIPGLLSTAELRRSQSAERSGNGALALSWANDAVGAEPWSASAYQQRGLVEEAQGDLVPAADDLQQAIVHEPTNYAQWLVLARIQTERGLVTAAIKDYDQAKRLRPQADVFRLAPYFAAPGRPAGVLP